MCVGGALKKYLPGEGALIQGGAYLKKSLPGGALIRGGRLFKGEALIQGNWDTKRIFFHKKTLFW